MTPRRYPHPLAIAAVVLADIAALAGLVGFVAALFTLAWGFSS